MTLLLILALAMQDMPASTKTKKRQDQDAEPPGAVRPQPDEVRRGRPKKEDYDLTFRVGMTLEYNDNIIRLDEGDLRDFRNGSKPDKFRIQDPQDWIYTPWAEASMALEALGESGRAGLRLTGYLYQTNTFASHPAFTAFLRAKPYGVEYAYEPSIYRREYRNLDTGVFESSFYDDHLLEAALRIPIRELILFRPKVGVEARDYDAPFTFRSSIMPFVAPRATLTVFEPLQPFVGYAFEWNQAFASGIQPDVSYYSNGFEVGVVGRPAAPVELELKYRMEYRVYTSSNDPSFDSHAGRSDRRSRVVAGVAWKVLPGLTVDAAYAQGVVLSDVVGDEESDWRRNQVIVGFNYVF